MRVRYNLNRDVASLTQATLATPSGFNLIEALEFRVARVS